MRGARARQAGAGRLRPGHVHQLGGRRDPGPARRRGSTARPPRRERAAAAARGLARRAGQAAGRAGPAGARRPSSSSTRSSCATCSRSTCKYGLGVDETPRLDDPDFVSTLVFDPARGATTPKARFAYLFPSPESAAIQVRLEAGPVRRASASGRPRSCARRCGCRTVAAARTRRRLHGDRRAGAGRGPRGRARGLGRAAAAWSRSS